MADVEPKNYFDFPMSPMLNAIIEVLSCGAMLEREIEINGKRVNEFAYRRMSFSHNYTIEVNVQDYNNISYTCVRYYNKMNDFTIGVKQDKIISGRKPELIINTFTFVFKEMTGTKEKKGIISYGKLTQDYITFHLKELVAIGLYSNANTARNGYRKVMDALGKIIIQGWTKDRKGKNALKYEIEDFKPLFLYDNSSQCKKESLLNGLCVVNINENINWKCLFKYWIPIPKKIFELDYKTKLLLIYICYLSRTKATAESENIQFKISVKALAFRLSLPYLNHVDYKKDENGKTKELKDKRGKIQKVISDSIGVLNKNITDISIRDYENQKPHSFGAYYENGYILVTVTGQLAKSSIEMAKRQNEIISSKTKLTSNTPVEKES